MHKTALGQAEKLTVLLTHVHENREISRELLIERVFCSTLILRETFRVVGKFSQDDSSIGLTRLSLIVSEDIREMSVIVHFSLSKATAVTLECLLIVIIDLVELNITIDLLLVGRRNTEESSPVACSRDSVSNDLAVRICQLSSSFEDLHEFLLSLEVTVEDLSRSHHSKDIVVHPSHVDDWFSDFNILEL